MINCHDHSRKPLQREEEVARAFQSSTGNRPQVTQRPQGPTADADTQNRRSWLLSDGRYGAWLHLAPALGTGSPPPLPSHQDSQLINRRIPHHISAYLLSSEMQPSTMTCCYRWQDGHQSCNTSVYTCRLQCLICLVLFLLCVYLILPFYE